MSPSRGQGRGWLAGASGLFLELPGQGDLQGVGLSRQVLESFLCPPPTTRRLCGPQSRIAGTAWPWRLGRGPQGPKCSAPFAVLSLGQITTVAFKPQSLHRQKEGLNLYRIGVRSVRVIPAGGTEEAWSMLPSLTRPPQPPRAGGCPNTDAR